MTFPKPVQGLVVRYSYLWRAEYLRGQEEGVKDRPCAVVLVTTDADGEEIVTVLPITHSAPATGTAAVEIPLATKRRLGLDSERSWVILTEANRFIWPGPDLRPMHHSESGSVSYGLLPAKLIDEIRTKFAALIRSRMARAVTRTD